MIKYKSEAFRKGVTDTELEVRQCFDDLGIPTYTQQGFCFQCNERFYILNYQYPKRCCHCGHEFDGAYQYCMPDIIIDVRNQFENPQMALIFVNGPPHDEPKRKAKDKFQVTHALKVGILPFTITNEEWDNLKQANRILLCMGIYEALLKRELYDLAYLKEKELPK